MQILFTCGREPEYPRNAMWHTCLKQNFNVSSVTSNHPSSIVRYLHITSHFLIMPQHYDLYFVGFLGQPIVPVLRILTHKPIIFDAFMSIYDTLCFDRRRFKPWSLPGQLSFLLDYISCKLADLVVLDTHTHAEYFRHTFQIPPSKLRVLFVGCDESVFYPRPNQETIPRIVLFYGSFLPLHGVDIIIRAAKKLESEPNLRFRIIGRGIEYTRVKKLANRLNVKNVDFCPPVSLTQLPEEIAQATICLGGHFGLTAKARRVIASKTFQCIAMGKATIVGDNPANRELLTPGYDAWFCPMDDPDALADAILTLLHNPELRDYLGRNGLQTFLEKASTHVLTQQVRSMVYELVSHTGG